MYSRFAESFAVKKAADAAAPAKGVRIRVLLPVTATTHIKFDPPFLNTDLRKSGHINTAAFSIVFSVLDSKSLLCYNAYADNLIMQWRYTAGYAATLIASILFRIVRPADTRRPFILQRPGRTIGGKNGTHGYFKQKYL